MKLLWTKVALFGICLHLTVGASRAEALEISVLGSWGISDLTTQLNSTNDAASSNGLTISNGGISFGNAFGGGVLLAQEFAGKFSLQTGFLVLPRSFFQNLNYSTSSSSGVIEAKYTYTYQEIPILIRMEPTRYFSFAVGGYYAHAIGNVHVTATVPDATLQAALTPQYPRYEDFNVSRSDYGFLATVGLDIPLGDSGFAFTLEGWEALGLNNIHNGGITSVSSQNSNDVNHWLDVRLMAGLTLTL